MLRVFHINIDLSRVPCAQAQTQTFQTPWAAALKFPVLWGAGIYNTHCGAVGAEVMHHGCVCALRLNPKPKGNQRAPSSLLTVCYPHRLQNLEPPAHSANIAPSCPFVSLRLTVISLLRVPFFPCFPSCSPKPPSVPLRCSPAQFRPVISDALPFIAPPFLFRRRRGRALPEIHTRCLVEHHQIGRETLHN